MRDQLEYSWRAFYNQCRYISNIIKTAQQNYLKGKIEENKMITKLFLTLTIAYCLETGLTLTRYNPLISTSRGLQ